VNQGGDGSLAGTIVGAEASEAWRSGSENLSLDIEEAVGLIHPCLLEASACAAILQSERMSGTGTGMNVARALLLLGVGLLALLSGATAQTCTTGGKPVAIFETCALLVSLPSGKRGNVIATGLIQEAGEHAAQRPMTPKLLPVSAAPLPVEPCGERLAPPMYAAPVSDHYLLLAAGRCDPQVLGQEAYKLGTFSGTFS